MSGNGTPASRSKTPLILAGIGLVALAAVGIYLVVEYDLFVRSLNFLDEKMPAGLFIALIAALPVFGVPFSPFLVLAGIKFGAIGGLLLLSVVMPAHLLISYALARFLHRRLRDFLERFGYGIPNVPAERAAMFSFLWLAVPGMPYAIKNFALPLAGVPFRYCFWMNWAVQGAYGVAFVLLGRSAAEMNPAIFSGALLLLGAAYALAKWLKSRFGDEIAGLSGDDGSDKPWNPSHSE
jgi:uncharacterized membrane protein YdjX (TVP38/TMEM64 family)